MMNMRATLAAAVVLLMCQACGDRSHLQTGGDGEFIDHRTSIAQIRAALRGTDARQVSRVVVQLSPMRDREQLRELLEAAWNYEESKYPDLNWEALRSTDVRVAVAQVLAKWTPTEQKYIEYVRSVAKSTETDSRFDALMALGSIGSDADLLYLRSMAYGPDEFLATGALSGLFASRREKGLRLLEEAAAAESLSEDRRKFALQLLAMPRPE